MSSIKTAVILAAGLGSRLGDLKEQKPKAFLSVGGQTLIHRSIQLLIRQGIDKIIIGTGYKNEFFDDLRKEYPQVMTFRNDRFDQTGSMYTLYVLRDLIEDDILLLEGDLLYEAWALQSLLTDSRTDIILASDATHSGDEVFIQSDSDGLLQKMSKDRSQLHSVRGELVGISKLSLQSIRVMVDFAKDQYEQQRLEIHYEDALVGISSHHPLHIKVERDLAWCEIDDASHLKRATELILPKIREREK